MAQLQRSPIRKKTLGSYPHTMVVFSITLALLVIGLFGLLLIHAHRLSTVVKESIEVQVFLDRDLPETQLLRLHQDFARKKYIAYKGDQPQVRFLSKEEAARELLGPADDSQFRQLLGDNPLHDAFILNINAEYSDSLNMRRITDELRAESGVDDVAYVQSLIDSVNKNLRRISLVLLTFAALLTIVVVVLINNTIRLALYSQRFLIRSMQLVGATSFFIQRPFLRRATWQGFMSGILAGLTLLALLQYAYLQVDELRVLRDDRLIALLFAALIGLGCIIGFLSSYRAVRKYLGLSLDDLY
ncbi:cell division protein FtsX [Hymenobacter cavernae]|nr:permease-like cell division protein FtsX [Hymenobacter cavernae]